MAYEMAYEVVCKLMVVVGIAMGLCALDFWIKHRLDSVYFVRK